MTPRKTATEISDLIIAQLQTTLSTTFPLLPKSFIRVLTKVLGGVFVLLYNYIGWLILQMFVKTASNDEANIGGVTVTPLKMWGSLVGILQNEGQRAEHTVTVTVNEQTGDIISGTRMFNPSTEMVYVTVGDVPIDAATITLTIRATEEGELGSMDAGAPIFFISTPSTVEKGAVIASRTLDGVDEEETEAFRRRILDRFAAKPQGGAYADYRDWAQAVTGVKRAYPYSGGALEYSTGAVFWNSTGSHFTDGGTVYPSGPGQVDCFIEASTGTDGIPSVGLLEDVWDHIEANEAGLANRRNINAYVNVAAITRSSFDVEVTGLSVEGLDAEGIDEKKAAIYSGVNDYFNEREPYIEGLDIPPIKNMVSDMDVGGTVGRLALANGLYVTAVSVLESSSPLPGGYRLLFEGEKAKLGTLYFDGQAYTP